MEFSRPTASITRAAGAGQTPPPADYLNARSTADYGGASRVGLMQWCDPFARNPA
ncbi:MAG TPA: hypothetical protein PKH77_17655 [Anaerolineae bacterium]|nr:hypothetical protein [Anaerolineae bacterium]